MNVESSFGRTIQLFLVDGRPAGLRKATMHGWTGVVCVAGAAAFGAICARAEVDRTGIYILTGADPDRMGATRVYVGSGNSVAERIRQSAAQRAFWETAITVTTSDGDLSKGHAEYLEARLIELTAQAGRVSLDNAALPPVDRRRLPEADRANMEQFLANLAIVLPVIGVDMLKPRPRAAVQTETPPEARTAGEARFEIRHRSGVHAVAVEEDGEFVVLEGSEALRDTGHGQQSHAGLKEKLEAEGVLVPTATGRLRLVHPCTSPRAAVVPDRNCNGRTAWRVAGTRRSWHDRQQARTVAEAG